MLYYTFNRLVAIVIPKMRKTLQNLQYPVDVLLTLLGTIILNVYSSFSSNSLTVNVIIELRWFVAFVVINLFLLTTSIM